MVDLCVKYNPKGSFEENVREALKEFDSHIVNVHIHGDRAYTRRDEYYRGKNIAEIARMTLREKQDLIPNLHKGEAFHPDCIYERMKRMLDESIYFGVKEIWTTVDVTFRTGFKSLEVAERLRKEYEEKIKIKIGAYNPSGFKLGDGHKDRWEIFEEAAKRADFLVGLAEKDAKKGHIGERQHNSYLLHLAYRLNKPVHFHVGQENRPTDNTLELLLHEIKEVQDVHLMVRPENFPEINAVHAISSSCKTKDEFNQSADFMAERNVGLICCPRAGVSMLQDSNYSAPIHNSTAKVWHFALRDVRIVGLGVDNLNDVFVPDSTADVYDEAAILSSALRYYRERLIAKLMCGKPFDNFDKGTIQQDLESVV